MSRFHLGLISTFAPREDGVAHFACDLLDAVCAARPQMMASVAAITEPGATYTYPSAVRWRVEQGARESYAQAGRAISSAGIDLACLQHEFGLYGVQEQERLLEDYTPALLETLEPPLVTTLHTVLATPHPSRRESLRRLCERSRAVVVLAESAVNLLVERYQVDAARIVCIPHGVPDVPQTPLDQAKRALQLEGQIVLSTFGLVNRAKGIEYVIRALPTLVGRYPNLLYLVLGKTHPEIHQQEDDSYRKELMGLAEALGVSRQVRFANRFLPFEEMMAYLQASDIYITPYLEREQISSGTLSYALSCGRAIISTPYIYAREVLADGRGLLAEFADANSIAACVNRYLDDPAFTQQVMARAWEYSRAMTWPSVGERYAQLFERLLSG